MHTQEQLTTKTLRFYILVELNLNIFKEERNETNYIKLYRNLNYIIYIIFFISNNHNFSFFFFFYIKLTLNCKNFIKYKNNNKKKKEMYFISF